ncbi:MAG: hypothetical protein WAO58_11580 [Fimbriimonadaceae bacterium]
MKRLGDWKGSTVFIIFALVALVAVGWGLGELIFDREGSRFSAFQAGVLTALGVMGLVRWWPRERTGESELPKACEPGRGLPEA